MWNLAPLGAVLVVVLLAGAFYALILTGGKTFGEMQVRAYFMSARGGSAPPEAAQRIRVPTCRPEGAVLVCTVFFRGQSYSACFVTDGTRIIRGSSDLGSYKDCEPVLWDRTRDSLALP